MSADEVENLLTAILVGGGVLSFIAGMAVVLLKGDR